jgi:chemotaxis protein MotB
MKAYEEIARKLRAAFDPGTLKIVLKNGRMVVQLPNQILFDFGKAQLKPEGKEILFKLAAVLQDVKDREFLVAGHTDNIPVSKKSKTYKTNWELSTLRSLTAIDFMQVHGTNPVQLVATGYGEHHPEADNGTEEGRAQNRRTELIIMPKLSEIPKLPKGDFLVTPARHARATKSR